MCAIWPPRHDCRGQPEGGPALAPMGTERQQGPPWLKWCAGGFLLPIEFGTGCARSPSRSVFLGLSHESQPARRNSQATIPKRLGPGQSRPAALFSEWCPTCSARKFPRTPRGGAHHPPGECGEDQNTSERRSPRGCCSILATGFGDVACRWPSLVVFRKVVGRVPCLPPLRLTNDGRGLNGFERPCPRVLK